jgi:predicted nucleic acid-binding protein
VKVVFDINVVASASFWRGALFDCLEAWAQGRCEAVVSPAPLAEYHEIIEELRLEHPGRAFVKWVDALTDSAMLVFPTDRDDEMILECALAAEADYIVSGDKRHLLALRQFRGILIISLADFLRRL